jgi:hypothetical protein
MIIFYPRDIGRWRKEFDFNSDDIITKNKSPSRTFADEEEFFNFLKSRGVNFDDPNFPLTISTDEQISEVRSIPGLKSVIQWTVIGWIKEHHEG